MSELPPPDAFSGLPEAKAAPHRGRSISIVWVVPLVALLIGGWLAWKTISETGPLITITFATADGIEAGKTKVRYKNVSIGLVETIEFAPDLSSVMVKTRMHKSVAAYLVEDSQFWVVRPRVTGTTVEGLGTLLSGAYIGMDVGKASTTRTDFTGLEKPPVVAIDRPGRYFTMRAETLGSLDAGSPVYYLQIPVGQVVEFDMDSAGKSVDIRIFVNAPYDRFVNSETRFYEVSGVSMELSATGLRMDVESLNSVLAGGIAFQTRGDPEKARAVSEKDQFILFKDRAKALAYEDREVLSARMRFDETVRGLVVGAPVDFRGITVGEVKNIGAELDSKRKQVHMTVDVELYPDRFRRMRTGKEQKDYGTREGLDLLVAGGLRAQLRTASFLSGQLYVAVDFFRDTQAARIRWDENPPAIPTMPGSFAELEGAVADILRKLQRVPLDEISAELRQTMKSLDATLTDASRAIRRVDNEVVPAANAALADLRKALSSADGAIAQVDRVMASDSALQQEAREALREVSRAAASLRALLEYLDRHPEAIIRGKQKEP
jgi:paraquat-inducible protein B